MKDRRIVLKTLTGRWAGLHEIQGTCSQLFSDLGEQLLPPSIQTVDFGDHEASAKLIAQRNSYVLYTEVLEPPADPDGA